MTLAVLMLSIWINLRTSARRTTITVAQIGCPDEQQNYKVHQIQAMDTLGTELVIDWFPRGWQHVTVRRDCRKENVRNCFDLRF